jgi:hypothetical protein
MIPPSIWLDAPRVVTRRRRARPRASTQISPVVSTATSATCTGVSTCIPVGFGPRALPEDLRALEEPDDLLERRELAVGETTCRPRWSASSREALRGVSMTCRSRRRGGTAGPSTASSVEPAGSRVGAARQSPATRSRARAGSKLLGGDLRHRRLRAVPMSCIAVTTVARPSEPRRIHA